MLLVVVLWYFKTTLVQLIGNMPDPCTLTLFHFKTTLVQLIEFWSYF